MMGGIGNNGGGGGDDKSEPEVDFGDADDKPSAQDVLDQLQRGGLGTDYVVSEDELEVSAQGDTQCICLLLWTRPVRFTCLWISGKILANAPA